MYLIVMQLLFIYIAEIHLEHHGTIPVSFEEEESHDGIEQVKSSD